MQRVWWLLLADHVTNSGQLSSRITNPVKCDGATDARILMDPSPAWCQFHIPRSWTLISSCKKSHFAGFSSCVCWWPSISFVANVNKAYYWGNIWCMRHRLWGWGIQVMTRFHFLSGVLCRVWHNLTRWPNIRLKFQRNQDKKMGKNLHLWKELKTSYITFFRIFLTFANLHIIMINLIQYRLRNAGSLTHADKDKCNLQEGCNTAASF